jgi:hypothetical protein
MGYTIETKQLVNIEPDLSTTEKCFAADIDLENQTLSAPAVSVNQPEVYFQIED